MEDHEKKELPGEPLEVSELEDEDLEKVAGGDNSCPIIINNAAGCGSGSGSKDSL